jgi:uncharacterized protein (TIGR02266 family)
MTQDTRKDRRAKIVSLNVRYKSATVDEFIDNHSHDVSKGGLFIKTASPFPPGTLLKFEIRIAGDKAVIAGVGRVVWKRETSQAGPEAPAGMGVKFIKIDDASRAVIDKLVLSRGEAKNAYDEGGGDVVSASATPERPSAQPSSAAVATSVWPGAPGGKDVPKPGAAPPVAGSGGAARPHSSPFQPTPSASKFPGAGKSTIAGLGGIQAPAKAPRTPVPAAGRSAADSLRPRTAPSGRTPLSTSSQGTFQGASSIPSTQPMFPKTSSEREMPPKNEQTVMKQAAELLEEALRGAGGSMEEIGQNPLFDLAKQEAGPAVSTAAVSKDKTSSMPVPAPRPGPGSGGASTSKSRPPPSNESDGEGSGSAPKGSPAPGSAAQSAPPLVSAARPAQGDIETTVRSATRDEATAKPKTLSARPSDVSAARPLAAGSLLAEEEPRKNKWLVPVLAVAGVGVLGFLFYTRIYAPGAGANNLTAPAPPPSARMVESASASASAPPGGSVAPLASAAPEVPSAAASTSASVSLDAAAGPALAASASAASPKPMAPAPAWHPPPKPKPKATAAEEAPTPAATEGTPQPTATPPPSESPPAPATASPAGTASSAAAAPPAPSASPPAPNSPTKPPAGKPKQEDDNPY